MGVHGVKGWGGGVKAVTVDFLLQSLLFICHILYKASQY